MSRESYLANITNSKAIEAAVSSAELANELRKSPELVSTDSALETLSNLNSLINAGLGFIPLFDGGLGSFAYGANFTLTLSGALADSVKLTNKVSKGEYDAEMAKTALSLASGIAAIVGYGYPPAKVLSYANTKTETALEVIDALEKLTPSDVAQQLKNINSQADFIKELQELFKTAEKTVSPLILDLNGDGVKTISKDADIHFDLDANQFMELAGWVSKEDGLLVLDKNGDGKINDGNELFGNNTLMNDGEKAANGFKALGDFDINKDGKINNQDNVFSQLRIWRDANSDGISNAEELYTLSELEITSINTSYANQTVIDEQGNQHLQTSTYTKPDGTTGKIDDVWFSVDTARTIQQNLLPISEEIANLPDVQGFGNVYSLQQAMAKDKTSHLKDLVQKFVNETDPTVLTTITTNIIYAWTGVENDDPTSRAATKIYGNFIGDARKLEALEAFLGEEYLGTWCWGERDPNPNGPANKILLQAFDKLQNYVMNQLMKQTHLESVYDSMKLSWDTEKLEFAIDTSKVIVILQEQYNADSSKGKTLIYELAKSLKEGGEFGQKILIDLQQKGDLKSTGFSFELANIGYNFISGTRGDDILSGLADKDNRINGGDGDDNLSAGNKNDVLIGGTGNDTLNAGSGINTFIFNKGDGQDVIRERHAYYKPGNINQDTLQLGEGITTANTILIRGVGSNSSNLTLDFGNGDKILLNYYFDIYPYYRLKTIKFFDGTEWGYNQVAANLTYNGTNGDDTLIGFDNQDNKINGNDGNDTLSSGNKNNILTGGKGNDTLNAGSGINTFIFNKGDGRDIINESHSYYKIGKKNQDTLQLGEGITTANTILVRGVGSNSDNLTLDFGNGDKILLNDYFDSSYRLKTIKFADSTEWGYDQVVANLTYNGTSGDDTLYAGSGADILNGGAGDDTLYAGIGINTFIFNKGDGQDVIREQPAYYKTGKKNQDILQLGESITTANTILVRGMGSNSNDLTLDFGNGDKILLKWYFNSSYRLKTIKFADSTEWGYDQVTANLIYNGTNGDDNLIGLSDQDNKINGNEGNDTLGTISGNKNNILTGGAGNDTLYAGYGVDTFIFNKGDGRDVINEVYKTNQDLLQLGEGITTAGTILVRGIGVNSNDLTLDFGNGDKILLNEYFNSSYRLKTIKFADSTEWGYDQVAANLTYNGTNGDDILSGLTDKDNRINGGDGNDIINAGSKNDILEGGHGIDILNAGSGINTFIFNKGDGQDVINSVSNSQKTAKINQDVLLLGTGITPQLTKILRALGDDSGNGGNNLVLLFSEGDQITIHNYFNLNYNLKTIQFADGTKWDYKEVTAILTYNGSNQNDVLNGIEDQENKINGYAGNDNLNGGAGKDQLDGGSGNDSLYGEAGNDTLYGKSGNDILNGGVGIDLLFGGLGNDSFDFSSLSDSTVNAADVIEDFVCGEDKIDLSGLDQHIAYDNLQFSFDDDYTLVKDLNSDFAFYLKGIYHLLESDFML